MIVDVMKVILTLAIAIPIGLFLSCVAIAAGLWVINKANWR